MEFSANKILRWFLLSFSQFGERNTEVSAWDAHARTLGQPTHLVVTHLTVKYQDFRKLRVGKELDGLLMKFKRYISKSSS